MMVSSVSDEFELIRRFKGGDKSVFADLIRPYYKQAYQIAYGVLKQHHDAEDATQNSMLKVYKSLETFKGNSSFKSWLIRIVKNHAIDIYRSNSRKNILKDNFEAALKLHFMSSDRADQTSVKDMKSNLSRMIKELSPRYREVIKLRYVDSLSYEEISDTLMCSIGTVKSRISRGKKQISTLISCSA